MVRFMPIIVPNNDGTWPLERKRALDLTRRTYRYREDDLPLPATSADPTHPSHKIAVMPAASCKPRKQSFSTNSSNGASWNVRAVSIEGEWAERNRIDIAALATLRCS